MKINGQSLPICFATNKSYLQHFMVALISLLKNCKGNHEIFVLNNDISNKEFDTIRGCAEKYSPHSKIYSLVVAEEQLPKIEGHEIRLGAAALMRLVLPELLPEKFNFALYLDADLIVNRQLNFENLPIEDYTIFAVKDPSSDLFSPKRGIEKMFNTGVLLINLKRWKSEGALNKIQRYKPPIARLADQELLNGVFDRSWFELPGTCNANALYLKKSPNGYVDSTGNAPAIIHFMGTHKPWIYFTKGSNLYWQYVAEISEKSQLKAKLKTLANSFGYSFRFRLRRLRKSIKPNRTG